MWTLLLRKAKSYSNVYDKKDALQPEENVLKCNNLNCFKKANSVEFTELAFGITSFLLILNNTLIC